MEKFCSRKGRKMATEQGLRKAGWRKRSQRQPRARTRASKSLGESVIPGTTGEQLTQPAVRPGKGANDVEPSRDAERRVRESAPSRY